MTAIQVGFVVLVLAISSLTATELASATSEDLHALLRAHLELSDSELGTLDHGRPVVKTLRASTNREIVTAGGVRIRGQAMTRFVEQFKALEGFRTSQFVLQLGKFSREPQLSDLDALTLEAADLESLRTCRVAACDVRLGADDIRRFQSEVDWRSPTAARDATALYKAILFAHLSAYHAGGRDRLVHYEDREESVRLAAETAALFDAKPSLLDLVPAFQREAQRYPADADGEHLFYWSKEAFGFKPVVGLNHLSVFTESARSYTMIVTTQIYASHYIDGAIAINALIPDPTGTEPAFYWLYQNRSRVGRLGGVLGALSRPIVQRRARSGLMKSLVQTKQRFEGGR